MATDAESYRWDRRDRYEVDGPDVEWHTVDERASVLDGDRYGMHQGVYELMYVAGRRDRFEAADEADAPRAQSHGRRIARVLGGEQDPHPGSVLGAKLDIGYMGGRYRPDDA